MSHTSSSSASSVSAEKEAKATESPPSTAAQPESPVPPPVIAEKEHRVVYEDSSKDKPTLNWDKPFTCCMCSCFNFVLQLVLVACCGSFLFGFNLGLLNTCLSYISWELDWCDSLSPNGEPIADCNTNKIYGSFISTAVFIGAAIGSMTGGPFLAWGRRIMMLLANAFMALGVVSSVCANSFSAMLFARLVVGYAVGLISVVCPAYMAEVTPKHLRGSYGVLHQLFVTVGISISAIIGLPLAFKSEIPTGPTPLPAIDSFAQVWWRVMLGFGLIPVILSVYLMMVVYTFDTPHYYLEQGLVADAELALMKITGSTDVKEEIQRIQDEQDQAKRAQDAGMSMGTACGVPEMRWVIFIGCLLSAFQQLGGINVFIASSNALFQKAGLSGWQPTVATVIMDLINTIMTLPAVPLIESMGRKSLLLVGCIGQTVAVVPATIMYWVDKDSDVTMWLAIVGCIVFIVFFAGTYGPILWVYLFEIYPFEIAKAASGLAVAFNWIAGIVMVFATNYLDNQIQYTIFTIMCALSIVIVVMFMKETKGIPLGESPYITHRS